MGEQKKRAMWIRRCAIALVLASVSAVTGAQKRDHNEVVMVETKDLEMNQAIRTARSQLDDFLKLAAKPEKGTSGYKLKVMVRDGEATEHFWVDPFRVVGEAFEGTLANAPRTVRNVKQGQLLSFTRDDISDWGYVRNGRQVGSFTVCVLFQRMPAEQAAYYRKNHGFDC
jgi:uncharacterized protein YegJ (DUF2314 family)